jgi:hypothetical protein
MESQGGGEAQGVADPKKGLGTANVCTPIRQKKLQVIISS